MGLYRKIKGKLPGTFNAAEYETQRILEAIKQAGREARRDIDRLNDMRYKREPKMFLKFETALVEHCNLRCAYCDHCSPIAEPEFADLEEFTRDFRRMAELFPGRIQEARLLGGEPLLHPEIVSFMKAARAALPKADIFIVTNGLLLPKMSEEFWETCREEKIGIHPTKYPIELDYDALEQLARDHGVEYKYYSGGSVVKTMFKAPLDSKGRQDPRQTFDRCHLANACTYLQKGRLYTCPVAPTARHLNKKFGTEFEEWDEDSIDIYKAASAQEVFEFLARPIPFCRYCVPGKIQRNLPWQQTEEDPSEWIL